MREPGPEVIEKKITPHLTEHEISITIKTNLLKNKDFSCSQTDRCCIYHVYKC